MLAPDSYEAHLTDVKKALIKSKIETVIVLGGYTKYIQAPDVVWNKPFNLRGGLKSFLIIGSQTESTNIQMVGI